MQILIIEDEPRAANQLEKLLNEQPLKYELIDVIDTVEMAVQWFQEHTPPDLVFMDIQLADGLSFEIFQHVDIQCPIIFTTAFDQYAIRAFKVNSIDYLLKPIKSVDLARAISKFQKMIKPVGIDTATLTSLLTMVKDEQQSHRTGVLVKEGSGFIQIKVNDILFLYSEDSITFAMTESKRYIIDETLDQFLSTVDQEQFFRINRGQAVQKKSVNRIEPYLNHRLKIIVDGGREMEFIVSRQRATDFKQWLNK